MEEISAKLAKARELVERRQVDGLLLRRISSFAWATGGKRSYINTAAAEGAASLLVTPAEMHLFTTVIEAERLMQEEGLAGQGWELHASPWSTPQAGLLEFTRDLRLACDAPYPGAVDVSGEVARLRAALAPAEVERAHALGELCAQAMTAAAMQIRPGMSEQQIAALVGEETQQRGAQPVVNLVATDERIFQYRHPLPTDKKLARYAMLVLCGRKWGLVVSITRLVHFGPPPDDVRRKAEVVAAVYAAFNSRTRPGRTLGEVFECGREAYTAHGLEGEWLNHHQGGAAGYEPREFLGMAGSEDRVVANQIYAWNPSTAGAKAEDTYWIGEQLNETLTSTPEWPYLQVPVPGGEIACPGILVR